MDGRPGDDRYLRGLEALERQWDAPVDAPVDTEHTPTAPPRPTSRPTPPNTPAGVDPLWAATVPGAPATPRPTRPAATPAAAPAPAARHAPGLASADAVAARRSIRSTGPILALILPAVLGAVAVMVERDSTSVGRGLGGFALAVLAAPALPMAGVPMRSGTDVMLIAVGASALLWLLLGVFAAQRATRSAQPRWARFWGEYAWMLLAVWTGTACGLLAANLVLGRSLL